MIELKQVSKRFNGFKALDEVSFNIKKGEIVGLLGPNGAGKTTTLRIIAAVLPPSKGEVLINHQNLNNNRLAPQLKKLIGYLPENNPLYEEMTVEEFLKFWAEIKGLNKKKQKEAIKFVIENTGIGEIYYRPINQLSKGYRQRVGLSQAILTKPNILLLDEPTEGLDPNQRKEIKQLIKNLGKNRTVIIASHVLSEISQICNRAIIINKGKVVGDDTVENLRRFKTGSLLIELEIEGRAVLSNLKKLTGVLRVEKVRENYFQVEAEAKKDIRPEIFNLAKKNKWTLLTMFKKQLELEDVFTKLTQG